jgi:hypothetical protein
MGSWQVIVRGIHDSLEITGCCSSDRKDIALCLAHTTEVKINFFDSLKQSVNVRIIYSCRRSYCKFKKILL